MGLQRGNTASGALREIVEREYPRDVDGLIAQLSDDDPARRRWAARDLAAHPRAARALGERLARETDAAVREALLDGLGQIGGDAAVEALLPLLRSEDPRLRNGAIETLGAMPQHVGPRIDALLADPDSDVRIFVVNLMGDLRHERVPQWLAQVLRTEPQVNVVAAAIEVLAEIGTPAELPALQAACARFSEPFIGFAAELAIERIGAQ